MSSPLPPGCAAPRRRQDRGDSVIRRLLSYTRQANFDVALSNPLFLDGFKVSPSLAKGVDLLFHDSPLLLLLSTHISCATLQSSFFDGSPPPPLIVARHPPPPPLPRNPSLSWMVPFFFFASLYAASLLILCVRSAQRPVSVAFQAFFERPYRHNLACLFSFLFPAFPFFFFPPMFVP